MKTLKKHWATFAWLFGTGAVAVIATFSVLADVPQPVLKIAPLGSNQFSIVITNGVATTNYLLLWRYQLENPVYPWTVAAVGEAGQTNFSMDAGLTPYGFFRAMIGNDLDGSVPDWMDAQPENPNVGVLTVTIDSPVNGAVFQ